MKKTLLLVAGLLFSVVASCSKDSPTSPAVAPTITTQPQSQTVGVGSAVSFTVVATGTPAPSYQWKLNGASISGATNASYTISSALSSDSGTYCVVVSNRAGSVTSQTATLSLSDGAPVITAQPQAQTVPYGASATFSVAASGATTVSFQWKKNGTDIGGATSASFTIVSATLEDTATYTVVVSTSAGSVTSLPAVLSVIIPPLDLTVVGKWEGAMAAIPYMQFNGAQIFAAFRNIDSTFRLVTRDATRGQTLPIKDTTLILTGTWTIVKARDASTKDSVLLKCDSGMIVDTALKALVPRDVKGQVIPVCISIARNSQNQNIEWTVALTDLVPLAPMMGLNLSGVPTSLLKLISVVLVKKSQI